MEAKREGHFELLRILLMAMIVGLHALYFGGVMLYYEEGSTLALAYGIESLFAPAVNCFVLISGYFSVHSAFRLKKFFLLWGQIVFYSVLFSAIYFISARQVPSIADMVTTFAPVLTRRWWFASAFLPLYLASGYLNRLLLGFDKKEYQRFLCIGFVLFVLWSSLRPFSLVFFPLVTASGYSFLFFLFLYSVGGYVRLHMSSFKSGGVYLLGYFLCASVTWGLSYMNRLSVSEFDRSALFFGYDTLWVFLSALFLFLAFSRFSIQGKIIGRVSPLMFGVYLIHEHPHVRPALYEWLGWGNQYLGLAYVRQFLFSVFVVFVCCTLIEWIRTHVIFRPMENLFSRIVKK